MCWASLSIIKVHVKPSRHTYHSASAWRILSILLSFITPKQQYNRTIGPSATELWCHVHFSRWRPLHRNSTSGFGFRDFALMGRSKSTWIPNFGVISIHGWDILLLPIFENKRPPCWNSTSGSDFYVCLSCRYKANMFAGLRTLLCGLL